MHLQASAQTPYVQITNGGPGELTNCVVPVNVRFARESVYNPAIGNYMWVMNRYVQRPNDTGFALMRGNYLEDGKTTSLDVTQAPAQMSNCTPRPAGTTVQWMTFQLKTQNYFGTDYSSQWAGSSVAGHIAVGLTWSANAAQRGSVYYDGIGAAIFKNGVMPRSATVWGERFGVNQLNQSAGPTSTLDQTATGPIIANMVDEQTYSVTIHASASGTAIWITEPAAVVVGPGTSTKYTYYDSQRQGTPYPGTNGTGYVFSVLCGDGPNNACQVPSTSALFNTGFRVDFMNIASGWF